MRHHKNAITIRNGPEIAQIYTVGSTLYTCLHSHGHVKLVQVNVACHSEQHGRHKPVTIYICNKAGVTTCQSDIITKVTCVFYALL